MENELGYKQLALRVHALAIFRELLKDEVLGGFATLLDSLSLSIEERTDAYCGFVASLFDKGGDFGNHLLTLVQQSENPVIRLRAAGKTELPAMTEALQRELELFTQLAAITPATMGRVTAVSGGFLPGFESTPHDFKEMYLQRLVKAPVSGYGIFAAYHMFALDEEGGLLPVKNPDPQRLSSLTGYQQEREKVLLNTRALLKGMAANNILLYGDAGTGKSSTVKAIGNEFAADGLRLIEVRKNQLYRIPKLMDQLAENPLKFVLFIDDLSFPADDGDFTALKAILEGNISARPQNIVVYATSNRRHMVKERFSDRMGEDVHLSDTLEEEASLAARFGLTITFLRPDRDLYGDIVLSLAKEDRKSVV